MRALPQVAYNVITVKVLDISLVSVLQRLETKKELSCWENSPMKRPTMEMGTKKSLKE